MGRKVTKRVKQIKNGVQKPKASILSLWVPDGSAELGHINAKNEISVNPKLPWFKKVYVYLRLYWLLVTVVKKGL